MSRKNQPKSQRVKKISAAQKKAQQWIVKVGGTTFPLSNFGLQDASDFDFGYKPEPIRKTLSYGSGYGWMGRHPEDLAILLKRAIATFGDLRKKVDIQAIAYTGSSGAAIAFPLAIAYELPIIYVRKKGERSHGGEVECNYTDELENYVIVDDFISSGRTVRNIMSGIKDYAKKFSWDGPECIGVFVFDPQNGSTYDKFALTDDDYVPTGEVVNVFMANKTY